MESHRGSIEQRDSSTGGQRVTTGRYHASEGRRRGRSESPVRTFSLSENISGGRGANTTVSVLEPEIRIERGQRGPSEDEAEAYYRIILFFKLQVKIHAFERGFVNLPTVA